MIQQQQLLVNFLQLLQQSFTATQNNVGITNQLIAMLKNICQNNQIIEFMLRIFDDNSIQQPVKIAACNLMSRIFETKTQISNISNVFDGLLNMIRNENFNSKLTQILVQSTFKTLISNYLADKIDEVLNHLFKLLYTEVQSNSSNIRMIRFLKLLSTLIQVFQAEELFDFLRDNDHLTKLSEYSHKYSILSQALFMQINNNLYLETQNNFVKQPYIVSVLYEFCMLFNSILNHLYDTDDYHSEVVETLNQTDNFCKFITILMSINLKNTSQIIICTFKSSITKQLNQMKEEAMILAQTVLQQCPKSIFPLCFNTFAEFNNQNKSSVKSNILCNTLILLERMSLKQEYQQIIIKNKSNISIALLNYSVANQLQIDYMNSDPQFFVQLANEFCQEQNQNFVKIKAISLLSNMCLGIDGMLSITIQSCLLFIDQMLKTEQQSHNKYQQILQIFINNRRIYQNTPFYKQPVESKLQTCILILASLADQIERRKQLKFVFHNLIGHRFQQLISYPSDLVKCRVIQLIAYIPNKYYMESYLNLLKSNPSPVISQQIISTHKKIISRGLSSDQLKYQVSVISFKLLSCIPPLSKLFEQIILNNPDYIADDQKISFIIQTIGQQIIKQIQTPQDKHLLANVNRLVNCLITFIDKIHRIKQFQQLFIPIFKAMMSNKNTEQGMIEIACCLVERMKQITHIQEQLIPQIAKIIQRNNFILNNLVELMNLHLYYKSNQSSNIILIVCKCFQAALQQMNQEDIVEILVLFETYLLQTNIQENMVQQIYSHFIQLLPNILIPEFIKFRIVQTIISGFYNHPKLIYSLLGQAYTYIVSLLIHKPKDHLITTKLRKNHNIYVMAIAEFEATRVQISAASQLIQTVLQLFWKYEQKQDKQQRRQLQLAQEKRIYQSNDRTKISMLLKDKSYIHCLSKTDEFVYFRQKIDNIIRARGIQALGSLDRQLIGKYYHQQIIGKDLRKIVRVKRRQ